MVVALRMESKICTELLPENSALPFHRLILKCWSLASHCFSSERKQVRSEPICPGFGGFKSISWTHQNWGASVGVRCIPLFYLIVT